MPRVKRRREEDLEEDSIRLQEKAEREDTKWLIRSVSLPVAECTSHSWKDFMKILHGAWRHSTDLANWASQALARNDVVRTPSLKCLPAMPPIYLYGLAFGEKKKGTPPQYDGHEAWEGAKIAAATLLRKVERKYRQERGKIVWRRERRTPEYLYPYPFPVHQQAWVPSLDTKKRPLLHLALPGSRVALRLRNGPEFVRAMEVFRQICEGEIAQQELTLCRQRSHASHRAEGGERQPGGGHRESYRIMARIAYRYEAPSQREGLTAELTTGLDPFLKLVIPGSHEWVLHAPWARSWIVEHRKFLNQFADDLKYEKRWPGSKRRGLNRYRERRCDKHANRMKSFLQETAAQVVGHAARRGAGAILFDDADRSFAPEFPWFALRERLSQKCDEAGLVFQAASKEEAVIEEAG